jgi:transcriptional regulator with XRE-family HTH domain
MQQLDLAKASHLSRTTIGRVECDANPPNITTLKRIADALAISMADLVREE